MSPSLARNATLAAMLTIVLAAPDLTRAQADGGADMNQLQGTWKLTAQESAGRAISDRIIRQNDITLVIKDDTWVETFKRRPDRPNRATFKIDESKSPKQIDLTDVPKEGQAQPAPIVGIYKLEGDTLTICIVALPKPRPTEFKSPDAQTYIRVFKRVDATDSDQKK